MSDSVLWSDLFRLAQQEADKGDGRALRMVESLKSRLEREALSKTPQFWKQFGNPISQRDEE